MNWHPPEMGAGRFGEWLANNIDWAISRDRYWGTPLPVWVNDADPDEIEVVGSYAELAERRSAVRCRDDFDPHKPHVDELHVAVRRAGTGTMRRVPEVIDAWFDSGSMPFAQWHYPFENRDRSQRSSRPTSSPRASTRRAAGSTRCSPSRPGSATRCRTTRGHAPRRTAAWS